MALSKQKIYLVDNDRIICHSLGLILENYGFNVEVYNSAEAFLKNYSDTEEAILLLDQNMLGMSGLELQQCLNERQIKIKTIFITAEYDAIAEEAMKNGALQVYEKPFDPKDLVEQINQYIVTG